MVRYWLGNHPSRGEVRQLKNEAIRTEDEGRLYVENKMQLYSEQVPPSQLQWVFKRLLLLGRSRLFR